jgi:hypothetical protein
MLDQILVADPKTRLSLPQVRIQPLFIPTSSIKTAFSPYLSPYIPSYLFYESILNPLSPYLYITNLY